MFVHSVQKNVLIRCQTYVKLCTKHNLFLFASMTFFTYNFASMTVVFTYYFTNYLQALPFFVTYVFAYYFASMTVFVTYYLTRC